MNERNVKSMRDTNLVNALREHAEWAEGNQWETPITLGDDLAEAADRIEAQAKEIDALAWRAARAMGYKRLVTYILESESGVSLKAAGWKCVGQAGGLRWTGKRRPEVDLCPAQMKIRFERTMEG